MKIICKISHEQPLENGGFKIYEAGIFYEKENPDPKYFDVTAEPQAKTTVETEEKENIGDPLASASRLQRKNKIEDLPKRSEIRRGEKGGYER